MTGSDGLTDGGGQQYRAYLIRLWRDGPGGAWRASLAHVGSGETHRFASLPLLWAYLRAQLDAEGGEGGEHTAGSFEEDTRT
jgi:hypothetical protein